MKKTRDKVLLSVFTLLIFLLIVPVSSYAASDSSASHYHSVCGTDCSCVEKHLSQNWSPFPSDTSTLTSGNYYLESSINFAGTNSLVINGDVSICLNGYNIYKYGTSSVIDVKSGTLTISDCVGTGKIFVSTGNSNFFGGGGAISLTGNGNLDVYGGTVSCDGIGAAISCNTTGNLTVYNGQIKGEYEGIDIYKVNNITVSSGTIIGTDGSGLSCEYGTFNNITISGGVFEGEENGVQFQKFTCTGKVLISGGTFDGKGPVPNATTYSGHYYGVSFMSSNGGSCNLTITGGDFKGARGGLYNNIPLLNTTISGGNFYSSKNTAISAAVGNFLIDGGKIYGILRTSTYNDANIIVTGGEILCVKIYSSSSGISSLKVYGGTIGRVGTTNSSCAITSPVMNPTNPTHIEIYRGTIVGTEYAVRVINTKTPLVIAGGVFDGKIADIYLEALGTTAADSPISMEEYIGSALTVALSSSISENTYIAKNVSQDSLISIIDSQYFAVYDTTNKAVYAHKHNYYSILTPPTCKESGYTTYTCSNCGESYIDNYTQPSGHLYDNACDTSCNTCGETRETTHTYESAITAPTCTEAGYTTYTCTVCGDSYIAYKVSAIGHSYNSVVTAPTETTQGYTTHTCINCGDSYKDNFTQFISNVQNMQVTATDTNITVAWDAPTGVTRYNLYVNDAEGNNLITRALAADATSVTLSWPSELEWGVNYTIGIRARTTKWLDTVYKDATLTVGSRVVDVKTQSVGRTIEVTWQAYKGATAYRVYVYEKDAYPTAFTNVKVTTNKATLINAIYAEVDYEVRVVAIVNGAQMKTIDAISVDARLNVFSPDAIIERGTTPNSVAVAWDQIRGVDKCWVYLNRVDGTGTEIIRETKGYIVGVYNLTPNTEYTVQIQTRIVDADGVPHYSGKSEVLGTISTTDWEDINFKAVGTDAGAELTWNAHTNAVRYYICCSSNGGKTYRKIATIEDGTVTNYTDLSAKNGYKYAIVVQIKDDYVAARGTMIKSEAIVK